jgi:hypothetical protein
MLKTLFVAILVVLPLAVAVVLIAYRARYFVLGLAVIVVIAAVIWAGIWLNVFLSADTTGQPPDGGATPIACRQEAAGAALPACAP